MINRIDSFNHLKLVKSMSDFTQVIKERNHKTYNEVVKNGAVRENDDGTFKVNFLKGTKIDVYA